MRMSSAHVPTINIAPLRGADRQARLRVAREISEACRGSGFFYAAGHGVDVRRLRDVVGRFHRTMTNEEKFALAINAYNKANPRTRNGYYMAIEGSKAVESFCYLNPSFHEDHPKIVTGTPMHEVNIWPDEERHQGFRSFCEEHFWTMFRLSKTLMRGIALALGENEDFFDADLGEAETLSAVSLIRYPFLEHRPPARTGPDGVPLSFEDHQDVSMITVLFQTAVQNLQVETVDGWLDLPTDDRNFLVNTGTYLALLTGDHFPAPSHRVRSVNAERLSLPFFLHAGHDTLLPPVAAGRAAMRYGDYLRDGLHALIVKNGQT
jgi:isopenicillin-N synthase